jgi:hypothetical protein
MAIENDSRYIPANATARWKGFGKTDDNLSRFMIQTASNIRFIWGRELNNTQNDQLDITGYRNICNMVGNLGANVRMKARDWLMNSEDARKGSAALELISYQALKPTISGITELQMRYPKHEFDINNLLALGILTSYELIKDPDSKKISQWSARIRMKVTREGERTVKGRELK